MKITYGKSIEITEQLSSDAAMTIAQWIGGYTVIYNQKTIAFDTEHKEWAKKGKPKEQRPMTNTCVAYLLDPFEFLQELPSQIRRNAGAKWFEALKAARLGIRKRPKIKPKNKKRNCYVTNELFDIQALDEERCLIQIKKDATKKNKGNYLCGVVMPFPKEEAAKSLYLSRKGSRFWLSMSYNNEVEVLHEKEIKTYVSTLSEEQLDTVVVGYDLGVKRQVTGSDKSIHHRSKDEQHRLEKLEIKKAKYQRRYARKARANDRQQGTNKRKRTQGEVKLSKKLAKYSEKKAAIQRNNSHHISKAIADSTPLIAVFEDIKINNQ